MVIFVSVSTLWEQANPRTCMPSFIHFMIMLDWEISVFLLNNLTFKCQRISLAFLTRYGRVMPSTYHEVIRLCIHDKKLSFMTSQVCVRGNGFFSDSTKTLRWKWAVTVVKRENTRILESIFWTFFTQEICVSPQCHTHSARKTQNFLLRARFPVRWDVYVYVYVYVCVWVVWT